MLITDSKTSQHSYLGAALLFACDLGGFIQRLRLWSHNGGPAGLIYAFLFVWTGSVCVVATTGELIRMRPTAGG